MCVAPRSHQVARRDPLELTPSLAKRVGIVGTGYIVTRALAKARGFHEPGMTGRRR